VVYSKMEKIKDIIINYCEANSKYDLIVNGELLGKHYNLREAIKHLSRVCGEDYSEEQAKEYLQSKGYSYERFLEWMKGQTVRLEDGKTFFYNYDVERFK
jgi:hypothetical protein